MATPLLLCLLALAATSTTADVGGTIGFTTMGRMNFHFDVYTLTLPAIDTLGGSASGAFKETRVTLGESVSYNAQLVESQWDSAVVEDLRHHGHDLQGNEAPELSSTSRKSKASHRSILISHCKVNFPSIALHFMFGLWNC